VRTNIISPILTEPELIAVTNPFGATQPTGIDAIGWYRKLVGKQSEWATYKHVSKNWWLWLDGDSLVLTQTAPGVAYTGDFYIRAISSSITNFQGVYYYKVAGAAQQLDVYIWSPFDIVLSRIIEVLRLHHDLADLIKPGNVIDISGGGVFTVTKDRKSPADLPEITIEPIGGAFSIADSTSAKVTQKYGITLLAGEEVVSRYYFPVKWALIQALIKFLEPQSGGPLDLFFVNQTQVTDVSDSMNTMAGPRRSEFSVSVSMYIDRIVLRGT
jgi:hypothetical protein